MSGQLGRRAPTDWRHVEKYPLTASTITAPRPVVIGINWYSAFDNPTQDSQGHWWVGRNGLLGSIRGGHCVCLKPRRVGDVAGSWKFYDQGTEGACVGFGWSRCQSLLNRTFYDAPWLYHEAQKVDEWPGEDYDGTSVRAGGRVLIDKGHKSVDLTAPLLINGISAYRWVQSIDDVLSVLGYQGVGYVDLLNSWGRSYPHLVRMPLAVLDRMWREDGEFAVPTDR